MIFEGMGLADVNLRLAGTWVMCTRKKDTSAVPCLVVEALGSERSADGYLDADITHVRGYFNSDEKSLQEILHIEHTPPTLGYVMRPSTGRVYFVSRVPERQSRSGLPGHSIFLSELDTDTGRLSDVPLSLAAELVQELYTRPLKEYGITGSCIQSTKDWLLSSNCFLGTHKKARVLYGPDFIPVGEVRLEGNECVIKTQNPLTAQTLLGGAHG
jgi:hypothetical protein